MDVPSGRVTARVSGDGVAFRNVPSYVLRRDIPVSTSRGEVTADLSYGSAFYASVPASAFGLSVTPDSYADLIAIGREIKWALDAVAVHPTDPRLSGLYGTILYDDVGSWTEGPHQRNLAVFADGEADRSPCGSGTSARLALLHDEGRLGPGQTLRHDSIVGTTFLGRVVSQTSEGVITEVVGSAYRTGTATFTLDPRDPLGTGFVLR